MIRKLILKSAVSAITLPVTPKEYFVSTGMDVESVDIHTVGTYSIPTNRKLSTIKLEFELPSSSRSYCVAYVDQTYLLDWLMSAMTGKTALRFLVSGTNVNVPVFISSLVYGECDGTNDIACTMELVEQRTLSLVTTVSNSTSTSTTETRTVEDVQTEATTYTIQSGDTLWSICAQYYGDGSLCYKLASYNDIANANLIYAGDVLTIPAADVLGATEVTTVTTNVTVAPEYYTFTIRLGDVVAGSGLLRASYKDYTTGNWVNGNVGSGSIRVCKDTTAGFEVLSAGSDTYSKLYIDGTKMTMLGLSFAVYASQDKTIVLS